MDYAEALVRIGAILRDQTGAVRPTLAGLLCLGRDPQLFARELFARELFAPQLFASFGALPDKEFADSAPDGTRVLDNATCDGTIPEILQAVLAAVCRNMGTAITVSDSGRTDRSEYPAEVVRELVVNALLHRVYPVMAIGTQVQIEMYPDRLVVKSPGGLYGSVTPGQLGAEAVSSTRNTYLARLLAEIADVDGFPVSENRGSGLPRVVAHLRDAGMSPPDFGISPGHVHVTVPQHALLDPETVLWIRGLGEESLSNEIPQGAHAPAGGRPSGLIRTDSTQGARARRIAAVTVVDGRPGEDVDGPRPLGAAPTARTARATGRAPHSCRSRVRTPVAGRAPQSGCR